MDDKQRYKPDVSPILTAFCVASIGGGGLYSMTHAILNPETSTLPILANIAGASLVFATATIGVAAFVNAVKNYDFKL